MIDIDSVKMICKVATDDVSIIRGTATRNILMGMCGAFKRRYPKRKLRLVFAMGSNLIVVDDVLRHEGDRDAKPFQEYFDVIDVLDDMWENRGVYHEDIEIDPVSGFITIGVDVNEG